MDCPTVSEGEQAEITVWSSGATCDGSPNVTVHTGFWLDSSEMKVLKVPYMQSRPHKSKVDVSMSSEGTRRVVELTDQCAQGYDGKACVLCANGWVATYPLQCQHCPAQLPTIALMLVVILAKIIISMYSAQTSGIAKERATKLTDAGNLAPLIKIGIAHCAALSLVREAPWTLGSMKSIAHSGSTVASVTDFTLLCSFDIGFYESFWLNIASGGLVGIIAISFGAFYGMKKKHFVKRICVDSNSQSACQAGCVGGHLASPFEETVMLTLSVLRCAVYQYADLQLHAELLGIC